MSIPSSQSAIILPSKRSPYKTTTLPVQPPSSNQVLIKVLWTASTPLDLHYADGGLLIPSYPFRTGNGGAAGQVVQVGDGDVKDLTVGDRVISFAFHGGVEANHQEYITVPAYLVSKIPHDLSFEEAVTIPVNLVTIFHSVTTDLDLELPWPIPQDYTPPQADEPILVWGASSSVGLFALQVLRHWGYKNVLAVASGKHHEHLQSIGATQCFDYRKGDITKEILNAVPQGRIPYILDCIGSLQGSLKPITKVAREGTRVAIMLPVIVKDATEEEEPEYEMDVSKCLVDEWAKGAVLRGVRTHFYLDNPFFKETLQPEIIPELLRQKIIKPNAYRIVEGATVVERAQNALDILRRKDVSGEKLVWKVGEVEG